jgi:predicted  nucleic acid-binding Zn-ribbon protein
MDEDQARLLDLQALDTALDQLRHRIASHPLRAQLAAAQAERAAAAAELERRRADRGELLAQQERWEAEVAAVRARRAEVEGHLYGGSVTSPKELLALQADLDSLSRRQRDLEDHELEVMEQVEQADVTVERLEAALTGADRDLDGLRRQLAAATAELEAQQAELESARAETALPVPADLLERYDRLRAELGGVAVARLNGATCEGCHLSLPATELDRLRRLPPGELARCDACGRMLVR